MSSSILLSTPMSAFLSPNPSASSSRTPRNLGDPLFFTEDYELLTSWYNLHGNKRSTTIQKVQLRKERDSPFHEFVKVVTQAGYVYRVDRGRTGPVFNTLRKQGVTPVDTIALLDNLEDLDETSYCAIELCWGSDKTIDLKLVLDICFEIHNNSGNRYKLLTHNCYFFAQTIVMITVRKTVVCKWDVLEDLSKSDVLWDLARSAAETVVRRVPQWRFRRTIDSRHLSGEGQSQQRMQPRMQNSQTKWQLMTRFWRKRQKRQLEPQLEQEQELHDLRQDSELARELAREMEWQLERQRQRQRELEEEREKREREKQEEQKEQEQEEREWEEHRQEQRQQEWWQQQQKRRQRQQERWQRQQEQEKATLVRMQEWMREWMREEMQNEKPEWMPEGMWEGIWKWVQEVLVRGRMLEWMPEGFLEWLPERKPEWMLEEVWQLMWEWELRRDQVRAREVRWELRRELRRELELELEQELERELFQDMEQVRVREREQALEQARKQAQQWEWKQKQEEWMRKQEQAPWRRQNQEWKPEETLTLEETRTLEQALAEVLAQMLSRELEWEQGWQEREPEWEQVRQQVWTRVWVEVWKWVREREWVREWREERLGRLWRQGEVEPWRAEGGLRQQLRMKLGPQMGVELWKKLGLTLGEWLGKRVGKRLGEQLGKHLGEQLGELGEHLGEHLGKELEPLFVLRLMLLQLHPQEQPELEQKLKQQSQEQLRNLSKLKGELLVLSQKALGEVLQLVSIGELEPGWHRKCNEIGVAAYTDRPQAGPSGMWAKWLIENLGKIIVQEMQQEPLLDSFIGLLEFPASFLVSSKSNAKAPNMAVKNCEDLEDHMKKMIERHLESVPTIGPGSRDEFRAEILDGMTRTWHLVSPQFQHYVTL